jgi:uncharacterized protein involved in type VI secretion and phage assembly
MKKVATQRIRPVAKTTRVEGGRIGRIVRVDDDGQVWVDFDGNPAGPLAARLGGAARFRDLAAAAGNADEVLLIFESGDPGRPIVLDTVHTGTRTAGSSW